MDKRLMLLINPAAGRSGYKSGIGNVLEEFCAAGYRPEIYMTKGPGDATNIVASFGKAYDIIVCAGGDGTLSETVAGIMELTDPPPLGYIPTGTANDVAATLGLSHNPSKAARKIINGAPVPLDVGSFGSNGYFTYIAAFGAFTEVSYETPQDIKNVFGHLAYLFTGMFHIPNITPIKMRVEYDGGVIEEEVIFGGVTNSTSIAGLIKLGKNTVELGDGLFEVILVRNPRNFLDTNKMIIDILSQNHSTDNVKLLRSKSVRFIFENAVPWTRDGENGGEHKDLLLVNHHGAVNIIL